VSILLERLERYYDAVPRATAGTAEIGPFTLFVARHGWPFYARPRLGEAGPFTQNDLARVCDRQAELGVPVAFEWVHETTPALLPVARDFGLKVVEGPLMVLHWKRAAAPGELPAGITLRTMAADDPALPAVAAVASVSFRAGGVDVGDGGPAERDAVAAASSDADLNALRDRIRAGRMVTVVAADTSGPIAVGSHQPVDDVTEIVGVATLPARRRLGLGAAVTAALVADAELRNIDIAFLSAGSEAVARIYTRIGFFRVATACIASTPDGNS
jgi:ribosomal protein S18 acetylase RimI-like enzyme